VAFHSDSLKQRRRRVTRDQSQPSAPTPPRNASSRKKKTRGARKQAGKGLYSCGARRSHQLRTTDLIPKRLRTVVLASLALLVFAGALNAGHWMAPNLKASFGEPLARILDLGDNRCLARSYSGLLLFVCGLASLQIFLLRMHRRDDYRGKYRVWIWIATACFAGGLVATSTLFDFVRGCLFYDAVSTTRFLPWALLIKLTIAGLIAGRVIAEIRHSRMALGGMILLALLCAAGIVLPHFPEWRKAAGRYVPALGMNLVLVATSTLLVSLAGFARFVFLEANGMLRRKQRPAIDAEEESRSAAKANKSITKSKAGGADEADGESETESLEVKKVAQTPVQAVNKASAPAPAKPAAAAPSGSRPASGPLSEKIPPKPEPQRPVAKPEVRNNNVSPSEREFELPDDEEDGLSKAERRRLRKQKRRAA
jgi:hypothetical protein